VVLESGFVRESFAEELDFRWDWKGRWMHFLKYCYREEPEARRPEPWFRVVTSSKDLTMRLCL
jgi:hypothetical protein